MSLGPWNLNLHHYSWQSSSALIDGARKTRHRSKAMITNLTPVIYLAECQCFFSDVSGVFKIIRPKSLAQYSMPHSQCIVVDMLMRKLLIST